MQSFASALTSHVQDFLRDHDPEYVQEAIQVLDARNHLFRTIPAHPTDESQDIYAIRDLCHVDEEMQTVPDPHRILSVARNYFC